MGMKNRFQEAIQNVQRQRHLARRSVAMVLVLAMLTAMSVSWRLHQDGIALTADDTRYYCGKEEHKHTDDCYIEGTEPICGYEEGEIVEETMDSADDAGDGDASAADWDEAGSEPESEPATQEEPEPEVVLHHHTADCYEEEEVLTCGIESDHVHQDYCYDQETGELLCTEHEHTDDCYTLEEVLVCGQEEGEPEKTDDGAALYDGDENSAEESDSAEESVTEADPEPEQEATKPETDDEIDTGYTVHHHTAECYGKVLICGKEEHEHTADCLVNPNAEIDAEYDAKTPERTSVDWAQDMVLVARSQLGYTESKADVDEDGNGYTMYADQYYKDKPMVYADWDSTFVAYCLYHAGVPQDIIPQYASISALRGELARMNSEYYTDDPQEFASILPGDIVMYKNAEGRETIGVVSDATVDEETDLTTALTVISGDVATGCESDGETTIDQVAEVSVALNEVTSFVSVNAAEGYGISDLMEEDEEAQKVGSKVIYLVGEDQKLNETDFKSFEVAAQYKNGPKDSDWANVTDNYVFKEGDSIRVKGTLLLNPDSFRKDGNTLCDTIVWNSGLKLAKELDDGVLTDPGGNPVGTLKVTVDGVATIHFEDLSKFELAKPVEFWFTALATCSGEDLEQKITFPGTGTTVTVKKNTDIHAKKELLTKDIQYDQKGNPYLEYRVTVSSEKGTEGTVNIVDQIAGGTKLYGTYSNFDLKKYSSKTDETGESIPVKPTISNPASGAPTGAETQFEIDNLAALKAGERYELTYRYQLSRDLCTDKKLSGWIGNNVIATDTGNGTTSPDKTSNNFLDRIEKSGNYDSVTRKVNWTITVRNPGKQNLSGYVVTDAIQDSTAKIDKNTVKLYGGDKEDACNTEIPGGTLEMATGDHGFTYKFPKINERDEKPYYKIVYQSDAPNGETSIPNTVTITDKDGGDKDSTTANGNIQDGGSFFKTTGGNTALQDAGNGLQKATWYITALIPREKRFDAVTISDTFQPAKYDNGQTAEHYALLGELFDQLNNQDGQKGAMEVYLDNDNAIYRPQHWGHFKDGITVTYTFQTASGQVSIESTAVLTAEQRALKVTGFSVTVSSFKGIRKINIGNSGLGTGYTTYVDVSNAPEEVPCTIQNKAHLEGYDDKSAEYTYKKDKAPEEKEEIVKQVSYDAGQNYTNDSSKEYDYATAQQEGIFYKISLKPAKGRKEITVVDTLPDGLVYDPTHKFSAAQAVFSNKSTSSGFVQADGTVNDTLGSKIYWQADGTPVYWWEPHDGLAGFDLTAPENFTVTQSADGKKLIFTIKNLDKIPDTVKVKAEERGYQTIGIFYALQLTQDADWKNQLESSKVYQNTASWTGVDDASAKITVKRGDTHLNKTVEQSSNGRLTYTVDINPDGLTLNPKSPVITLYDMFTVNKRGTATLDRSSIKLYDHKENQDTKDYTLTTGEEKGDSEVTHYNMTLTVRDGRHYTFTYTYIVDRSQVNSNVDVTAENKARITAVWQEADKETIKSSAGGGSVGAKDGELTLYKVDKNSENKVLQGAVFELTAYDKESGSWNTAQKVTAITDENGEITFVPTEGTNDTSKVHVSVDTLYKLVETKAPNGYVLDAKPLYFIWMQNDASEQAKQKEAYKTATGKGKETDAVGADVTNYKDVTYFQTGRSYERKFTNAPMQLEFEKVWADEDGKITSPPDGVTAIQLKVYKYTGTAFDKDTAEVQTVTLNTDNQWREKLLLTDSDENTRYYVEEVDVPNGYKVTYKNRAGDQTQLGYADGDKVTVTNQKRPTKLTVYKNWCDQNGTPTSSTVTEISVTLHGKPKEGVTGETTTETVTLTAKGGWKHVFENLNPDYLYTVEESPISGFTVSYSYPEGSSDVAPGGTVTITNTEAPTYELPSTGSPGGTVPYTAGGAAIALAAVLCGYNSRRKRKRGEE